MSSALGAQECTHVVNLLEEMEHKRHKCVTRMDNQAVLSTCKSDTHCGRVKRLTVRHHHLRHQVTEGKADVERVPTKENPADILTKPLPRHTHQFHAARLVFGQMRNEHLSSKKTADLAVMEVTVQETCSDTSEEDGVSKHMGSARW